MKDKARKTIGLLISQLEARYHELIWPGIIDSAREHDANVLIFIGRSIHSDVGFDAQQNVIYKLPSPRNVDGLIIITGTIGNYLKVNELKQFCRQFAPLPIVNLGVHVEGLPSVLVDNKAGMRSLVQHFVDHGYKKIAFIRGPANNPEAELRYDAYREVLAENNLPFDPDLVAPGTFVYYSGNDAVKLLLDVRKLKFDALISANDDMLTGVYHEFQHRKIKIPEDIAIAGFDDIEDMKSMIPPMTTVAQPLYELAKKASEALFNLIDEKKEPLVTTLPAKLVVRQSCGCNSSISKPKAVLTNLSFEIPEVDFFENNIESIKKDIETRLKNENISVGQQLLHQIYDLIDTYSKDMKHESTPEYFGQVFYKLIKEDLLEGQDINVWNSIIDQLRILVSPYFMKSRELSIKSDYIFLNAKNILNEGFTLRYKNNWLQVRETMWATRRMSLELGTSFDISKIPSILETNLKPVYIKHCYLSFYHKKTKYIENNVKNEKKIPSRNSYLFFAYQNGISYPLDDSNARFLTQDILPSHLPALQERFELIVCSLQIQTDHFGIAVFDFGTKNPALYEMLREQISSSIKSSLLTTEKESARNRLIKALNDLNVANKKLQNLSQSDELTGLYNRRGFITLGLQYHQIAFRKNEDFALFFADLDGLKIINDTFGHKEGDCAIKAASVILKNTFRQADIISRLGGDEFVILAVEAKHDTFVQIFQRLDEETKAYNQTSNKPYKLSMSIGGITFFQNKECTFYELLDKADMLLYQQKQEKKARRKLIG